MFPFTLLSAKFNPIKVITIGLHIFYVGAVLTYGSTSQIGFLHFPGSFYIGCLMVGFGDAALNGTILIKFYFCSKWELPSSKVGQDVSTSFNIALAASNIAGAIVSGLSVSRNSERFCLISSSIAYVATLLILLISYLSSRRMICFR